MSIASQGDMLARNPVIGGIQALLRQLPLITKLKFALVILACLYFAWSFFYFHFIGSAHHY